MKSKFDLFLIVAMVVCIVVGHLVAEPRISGFAVVLFAVFIARMLVEAFSWIFSAD